MWAWLIPQKHTPSIFWILFKYVDSSTRNCPFVIYQLFKSVLHRFVANGSMSPHNEKLNWKKTQEHEISIVMEWCMWKNASDAFLVHTLFDHWWCVRARCSGSLRALHTTLLSTSYLWVANCMKIKSNKNDNERIEKKNARSQLSLLSRRGRRRCSRRWRRYAVQLKFKRRCNRSSVVRAPRSSPQRVV